MHYVYIYWDPVKDHPIYVGKGQRNRWSIHFKTSHSKILNGYLRNNPQITPECVEVFPHRSHEAALAAEIALIAKYGRKDLGTGTLLNLTAGGEGVREASEEFKARLSEILSSPKVSARLSTSAKQMWADGKMKNVSSLETRQKMSASAYAVAQDPEVKAKRSEAQVRAQNELWVRVRRNAAIATSWAKRKGVPFSPLVV